MNCNLPKFGHTYRHKYGRKYGHKYLYQYGHKYGHRFGHKFGYKFCHGLVATATLILRMMYGFVTLDLHVLSVRTATLISWGLELPIALLVLFCFVSLTIRVEVLLVYASLFL